MSAAARMRKHRERLAAGRMAVLIEGPEEVVDCLVEIRILNPMHTDDREKIAQAIESTLRALRVTTSGLETL